MKFSETNYGDLTGQHYEGDIEVSDMKLTSLEGAPKSVSGDFYCHGNQLKSLKYSPESVGGNFACHRNQLTTLEGSPKSVGVYLDCSDNQLTTLDGAPESIGLRVIADNNPNPHLAIEYKVRKENPNMSEEEFRIEMYILTDDIKYVPEATKDIFLF